MLVLVVLAAFTIGLAGLILYIFSKPLKTLIFIFKSRKIRAGIVLIPIAEPQIVMPAAVYEDGGESRVLILRREDFFSYGKVPLRDGRKATVFADGEGSFTTLHYFFRTLIQAVLLAAMPALLLIGSAGMLYYEITDYHFFSHM